MIEKIFGEYNWEDNYKDRKDIKIDVISSQVIMNSLFDDNIKEKTYEFFEHNDFYSALKEESYFGMTFLNFIEQCFQDKIKINPSGFRVVGTASQPSNPMFPFDFKIELQEKVL